MSDPSWTLPNDPLGAFCRENHVCVSGAASGPLAGLSFAAKDVFDVAGARTGCGHPDWLRTHPPAQAHALAVSRLLEAGGDLVGKTLSDELCYSLTGENRCYGTPVNPAAPGHIPGGSSNGSASAVAGGLVDFALGTDCGGSVRVPASYCGIFGMRPTHGRIPLDGVAPFAPSIDCVGWFARDPEVFLRVGRVLLADTGEPRSFDRLLRASDAFGLADGEVVEALAPGVAELARTLGVAAVDDAPLSEEGLEQWFEVFRVIQAGEVWRSLGGWIREHRPDFGPGIRERFAAASEVGDDAVAAARAQRALIAGRLDALLPPGTLLCLPTTPRPAPPLGSDAADVEVAYRQKAMALLCSAGLAGLPQITLPLGRVEGLPVGLSIVGRRGSDIDLLSLAVSLCGARAPAHA